MTNEADNIRKLFDEISDNSNEQKLKNTINEIDDFFNLYDEISNDAQIDHDNSRIFACITQARILFFQLTHLTHNLINKNKVDCFEPIINKIQNIDENVLYHQFTLFINRTLIPQLHAYLEEDIKQCLKNMNIEISQSNKHECINGKCCIKKQKIMNLEYYLNKLFKHIKTEDKDKWICFFNALTIIRNKGSHSSQDLNDNEINNLKKAGLTNYIVNRKIILSTERNKQIFHQTFVFAKTFLCSK